MSNGLVAKVEIGGLVAFIDQAPRDRRDGEGAVFNVMFNFYCDHEHLTIDAAVQCAKRLLRRVQRKRRVQREPKP